MIYNNNKYWLLNLKPRYGIFFSLIFVFIISNLVCFNRKIWDSKEVVAYLQEDTDLVWQINVDVLDTMMLNEIKYIVVDGTKYEVIKEEISSIMTDENNKTNYQIIFLRTTGLSLNNNNFYKIKIYYNEDYIYKKIINFIKG